MRKAAARRAEAAVGRHGARGARDDRVRCLPALQPCLPCAVRVLPLAVRARWCCTTGWRLTASVLCGGCHRARAHGRYKRLRKEFQELRKLVMRLSASADVYKYQKALALEECDRTRRRLAQATALLAEKTYADAARDSRMMAASGGFDHHGSGWTQSHAASSGPMAGGAGQAGGGYGARPPHASVTTSGMQQYGSSRPGADVHGSGGNRDAPYRSTLNGGNAWPEMLLGAAMGDGGVRHPGGGGVGGGTSASPGGLDTAGIGSSGLGAAYAPRTSSSAAATPADSRLTTADLRAYPSSGAPTAVSAARTRATAARYR